MLDKNIEELLNKARKSLESKEFNVALNFVNKVLEIKPKLRSAVSLKNQIISKLYQPLKGEYNNAIKFREFFKIVEILKKLGDINSDNYEYMEIQSEFEKNRRKYLRDFIDIYTNKKAYAKAIDGLTEYNKIYPEEKISTEKKIQALKNSIMAQKIQNYKALINKALNDKDYATALQRVNGLLELDRKNQESISLFIQIHQNYIDFLIGEKKYEDAANLVIKVLKIDPKNFRALTQKEITNEGILSNKYNKDFNLINTYMKNKRYDQVIYKLEEILKKDPNFKRAKNLLKLAKEKKSSL